MQKVKMKNVLDVDGWTFLEIQKNRTLRKKYALKKSLGCILRKKLFRRKTKWGLENFWGLGAKPPVLKKWDLKETQISFFAIMYVHYLCLQDLCLCTYIVRAHTWFKSSNGLLLGSFWPVLGCVENICPLGLKNIECDFRGQGESPCK